MSLGGGAAAPLLEEQEGHEVGLRGQRSGCSRQPEVMRDRSTFITNGGGQAEGGQRGGGGGSLEVINRKVSWNREGSC